MVAEIGKSLKKRKENLVDTAERAQDKWVWEER